MHWGDISDETHGFSLLNDCKYGYDAKGNVLRLSLLRSPEWPDPHADEGHHEFTYSLYAHGGSWRDALTVRRGYELNYPLYSVVVTNHQGKLQATQSFVGIEGNGVVLTALKKAEDNNSLILRFYEWAGEERDVALRVPASVVSAAETDLMERPTKPLPFHDHQVVVHTKPYEIKSVQLNYPAVKEGQ
jgi:alpha-mannosidase